MNTSTRRLLGGLATAAVLMLGQGGAVSAASPSQVPPQPSGPTGNEMLSVQPSLISISPKAGTTSSVQLTLRSAANLSLSIRSQGLAQGTDGSFKAVPDDQDSSPYSARTMITATPATLEVKPGDTVKVTVNVAVPESVGEGTRYSILTITGVSAAPGASSNVGFAMELGVSAIIQIAGTSQVKSGEIKNISLGTALPAQPLPVAVSFLNTGNAHYGALPNELISTTTLQDAAGALLATANTSGNQLSVIPSFSRDLALALTPSTALVENGKYHIEVGVGLKDGTVLDRKALDFTWSGGQVLGATSAPIQAPPVGATGPSTDPLLIIGAALAGALIVVLLFLVLSRLRRRPRPDVEVAKP